MKSLFQRCNICGIIIVLALNLKKNMALHMRYLTLFTIFISLNISAQNDTVPEKVHGVDFNVTDSKGLKQGEWIRVYEDGSTYYTGAFKDGKPKGEFRYYYDTEELMTVAIHIDHQLTETINYRLDGSVLSQGQYVNQKKHGQWKMYNDKGILSGVTEYSNDVQNGINEVYYDNGQLAERLTFADGLEDGSYVEYFKNGKLKGEGTYSNGKLHGDVVSYQSPGKLLYEGKIREGVAVGEWRYYLEDGRLELRILYDDAGREVKRKYENGLVEDYFPSGIPKSYYEYKNGKLHGLFEEFYDKGEFVRKEVISTQPGMAIEYKETLEKTQLKKVGEYRMGNLVGEVIYYKETGQIEKTEVYEQGVLIDTIVRKN
ncbi:MAG: toxin-antitoxin system YwqK family antitoxin [Flavobacteriales bacterium]